MNDEQDTLPNLHSSTPVSPSIQPILVAVATLVLAGSAVFWRSNLRPGNIRLLPNVYRNEQPSETLEDEHARHDAAESSSLNDGSKTQNARSKERRKRRKDPVKELMKGGKRAKDLAKLLKHVPGPSDPTSSSAPNSASSSVHLVVQEPSSSASRSGNLKRNRSATRSESGTRDPSGSRSSRSVSISSTEAFIRRGTSGEDTEEQEEKDVPLTAMPPSPVLPPISTHPGHSPSTSYDSTPSIAVSTYSFESADTTDTSAQSTKYLDLEETASSSSSAKNTRRNKNGNTKNSTSDNINNHHTNDASSITVTSSHSASIAPYSHQTDTGSSPSTLNASASSSSPRAGKAPRFRSQEPGTTKETSSAVGLEFSASMPIYTTLRASSSTPKLKSEYADEEHIENEDASPSSAPFSFPSLNGASSAGSNETDTEPSSQPTKASSSTPPPGSTTSSGVSTQTQIASLRGALEASRKREEEAKGREERTRTELERLGNEVKMLRWEGSTWRQREGELQAQVHHLAHQVQSYATYFAHPPQPPQFPHLQNLAIPQPQRATGRNSHLRGKRHSQPTSSASSRSTSKSSRPSQSSHASPIPSLAQLPEQQSNSQGSSSPSIGSPVPPGRMFSPTMTFSPGPSSTPFLSNTHHLGPFSPFGMFSPSGPPPRGMPFGSPPLGNADMMSPMSPQSPYIAYAPYSAYGGPSQGPSQVNGNTSNGPKMHPTQFLNIINNGKSGETGGISASSTMSSLNSLASGAESESVSPESSSSPSPAPGSNVRERGRKRGRGGPGSVTVSGDRMMYGYGSEFLQYGYPYGYSYPYPSPTASYLPGTSPLQTSEDNVEEGTTGGNDDIDSENSDDDSGQLNELLAGAILKRPESMMGLRSGSGSGRSSKSNSKAKDKLRLSPTEGSRFVDPSREGYGDETMVISPSSDSGLALGLDWLKDPTLFRREVDEVYLTPSVPMPTQSGSEPSNADLISTEVDLDTEFSSSSSSSTKSTSASSESPAKTPPMEFTFPSIATWGYSYQTHSAADFDGKKTMNENVIPIAEISYEPEAEEDLVDEATLNDEETTPPADKVSSHLADAASNNATITLDDQHGTVEETISG